MNPEKIPAGYYTHLVYGFSPLISMSTWTLENPTKDEISHYKAFNDLKLKYKGLKTMMSVGGDLKVLHNR